MEEQKSAPLTNEAEKPLPIMAVDSKHLKYTVCFGRQLTIIMQNIGVAYPTMEKQTKDTLDVYTLTKKNIYIKQFIDNINIEKLMADRDAISRAGSREEINTALNKSLLLNIKIFPKFKFHRLLEVIVMDTNFSSMVESIINLIDHIALLFKIAVRAYAQFGTVEVNVTKLTTFLDGYMRTVTDSDAIRKKFGEMVTREDLDGSGGALDGLQTVIRDFADSDPDMKLLVSLVCEKLSITSLEDPKFIENLLCHTPDEMDNVIKIITLTVTDAIKSDRINIDRFVAKIKATIPGF
jgi:hypothetical protein